ncbi:siderophore-interacting protein [Marinomonas posidonica]|uniref:Siderophore-interacting protein n=1 Tax=Marinomonas posidonica (strain CECT 7376 / NCIMB 14433 / IVIA-Po-181) TaxID=491952 RepID=F6D0L2_MARPP|nr:siderophore-interacting protein [Marinomonas posidonica]AEF54810.1 Siderophore-interacting protein [Marinomonas posidonica IVIA-Po-181]
MSRMQPRDFIVIRKELITPHMLRVTLGGENIQTIPDNQESGYVKLIFPTNGKPLFRTYTIRHQRHNEIDIDFMLHEDSGPASSWAKSTQPGDTICVGGPGPKKMIADSGDWYLLVGDMTALPAISVNLAQLPNDAKGYAVIEVVSESDMQPLTHPKDLSIVWAINPQPGQQADFLLKQVQSLEWLDGSPAIWTACEFNSMKNLRNFFKKDKAVSKDNLYISSYWKLGSNEDQHKEVKRQDAEMA